MAGPGGTEIGRVSIKVVPETSAFSKELSAYIKRIETELTVDIPTSLDITGFKEDLRRLKVEAAAADFTVRGKVDVDGGAAGARTALRQISSEGSALTTIMGQIRTSAASVGASLLTWGPPIVGAAAAAVSLAPAVLALVPAGVAGAGALGALALGLHGVGDAFQYAGDPKNVDKFNAAMKGLAPSARDTVKSVLALKPAFMQVQQATQQALFAGIAPMVAKLGPLLGVIKTAMVGFAGVMNGALRSLLGFVSSAPGMQLIGQALATARTAAAPLAGALVPIVQILLRLSVAAAPALRMMADGFLSVVQQINGFVTAGAKSGSLTRAITTAMSALGQVLSAAGSAIGPLLSILVKLGPLVIGVVVVAFRALGVALAFINDHSAQIAGVFSAIVTAVTPLAGLFAQLAAAAVPVINQVFAWLAANAGALPGILAAIGGVLQPLVAGFQGLISAIGPQLAPTFAALLGFVRTVLPVLQDFGTRLIGVVGPGLAALGQVIATYLLPAFQRILPVLAPVAAFLLNVIGGAVIGAVQGAINVIQGIVKVLSGVLDFITGVFTGNWGLAWSGIKTIFAGIWQAIVGIVQAAWAVIKAVFAGAFTAIKTLVGISLGSIRGLFASGLGALRGVAEGAWNLVRSAFSAGISAAVALVKALPGKILSALGDLGGLLVGAGKALLQGLVNGITGAVGAVISTVRNIGGSIAGAFKGALGIHSPSKVMQQLGQFVTEGLILGLTGSSQQVSDAAAKLGDLVKSAVDSYLGQKSTLADRIKKDAEAVKAAQKRYADVVKLHGLSAANAINSARNSVARASAKLAADKSHKTTAATIRKDAASLTSAQTHLQDVMKTQGTRTAIAVGNARAAVTKALAKLAGDKADLKGLNKQFGALSDPKVIAKVQAVTDRYQGILEAVADQREQVAARLKDAQDNLAEAMKVRDDYAASVKQAALSFASLTSAEGRYVSSKSIINNLRAKLAALNSFRTNLANLKAQGLSDDALKQLVDAGVEAGGATATALVKGGQTAVAEVNNLTAQISSAASDLGTTSATQFYQAGVDQAQALVTGLQAQASQLESIATAIAQQMVRAIQAVFAGTTYDYGFHEVNGKLPMLGAAPKRATPPVVVNVTNPVPETASESATRIMRRIATFGPPPMKTA